MSEDIKAIYRRFVDRAQCQGKDSALAAIDEMMHPDFVEHSGIFPQFPTTRDGMKQLFTALHTGFPDLRVTIHDQAAEGDKVWTHKTFYGTQKGEFLGIPPTGKEVSWEVIDIVRFVDGKPKDHWAVIDQLGLMQQLGVIPPMGEDGE